MVCLTCVSSVLGFVFLRLLASFWFLTTWWVRPMSSRSSCFWRNKWCNHEEMGKQKREITDWCCFLALRVSWFANERDNQVVKSAALEMAKNLESKIRRLMGDRRLTMQTGVEVGPCLRRRRRRRRRRYAQASHESCWDLERIVPGALYFTVEASLMGWAPLLAVVKKLELAT